MKKFVLIAILIAGAAFVACDKQKALDGILADPQMKGYIMQQILADETTRAELADSILADTAITGAYLSGMAQNEASRNELLKKILAVDSTGEWITAKLAENPEIKQQMRSASRR